MINVTETAVQKIKDLLEEQGNPNYGLRMGVKGGGCSGFQYNLAFDGEVGELDQVIEANGVKVFQQNPQFRLAGGRGRRAKSPPGRRVTRCRLTSGNHFYQWWYGGQQSGHQGRRWVLPKQGNAFSHLCDRTHVGAG